jgi:hypothetical protein
MSDQFSAPKPSFVAPKDNGLLTPKDQSHHVPAPSLVERAQNVGNDKVAQLLAEARERAKEQAKIFEKPSSKKKKEEVNVIKTKEIIQIDLSYVTTPEECIKRTRAGNGFNINDPEVTKLFYANDGAQFVQDDMTFALSFENWRRWKNSQANPKFKDEPKIPYKRSQPIPHGTKRIVLGLPSQNKYIAELEAKNRAKNQGHYGFVVPSFPIKKYS